MSLSEPSRHAASIMNPIEGRLGYKFRNGLLLAEAMTHPSISLERKNYPFDNQRLEFLGDAVIQVVVTEHLYRLYPNFSEGMMTKLRTRIVSRAALKMRAQELDLGRYLMMGRGKRRAAVANEPPPWPTPSKASLAPSISTAALTPPGTSSYAQPKTTLSALLETPRRSIQRVRSRRSFKPSNRAHRSTKFSSKAAQTTRSASSHA